MRWSNVDKGIEETQGFTPITRGDLMNSKIQENKAFRRTGWVVGSAGLLLLISAGLEQFVRQTLLHDGATVLLALFLAFWSYVFGLGLLLFLLVGWLVELRRVRVTRAAMSRYSPAEPRSRSLEKPEQQAHSYLEHGVATGVPIQSTRADENETHSLSRAA